MQDSDLCGGDDDHPPSSFSAPTKWICDYCTFENFPAAYKCTMCRAQRAIKVIEHRELRPEQPQQKWSCPGCTYLNFPKAIRCTQCLSPRKRGSPRSSPAATSRSSPVTMITEQLHPLRISVNNNSQQQQQPSPPSIVYSSQCGQPVVSPAEPNNTKNSQDYNERNRNWSNPDQRILVPAIPERILTAASKWNCPACTYENWPKAIRCTLCGTVRHELPSPGAGQRVSPPPMGAASSRSTVSPTSSIDRRQTGEGGANNFDYERKLRQLRRRMREADWGWLGACMGVVEGDMTPVEAYLNGGGDPMRKLTNPEVALLNRSSVYEAGHTLVHLAIRFHREDMLATLLSQFEGSTPGVKCVPSYVAPDLGSAIRRHISQTLRQRKGTFPCYYIAEWATYTLPPEIEDLPPAIQEQLYSELMDRDAQKELEEDSGAIINWSEVGSRLYALWNRSAGDCLLDSILQATWGVFDRDNTLRRAMSDSLHEAGHIFYPRWKEWETLQASELDFSLDESQWADDWKGLLNLASQPGAALEQLHVFCLAHVLRRPIIVYGVKYVKSWRGENLGYAKFEGVYLPLLWEPSFCSRSPIALGYTRGHFCALIPPEPQPYRHAGAAGARGATDHTPSPTPPPSDHALKSNFLPLMTYDQKLMPIHFLNGSEIGNEEVILRQWLDVCVTDAGLWVTQQKVAKPPLLVAQMTEEWLNHYRKLAQSSQAPFCSRPGRSSSPRGPPTATPPCDTSKVNSVVLPPSPSPIGGASLNTQGYSSDGDSDEE